MGLPGSALSPDGQEQVQNHFGTDAGYDPMRTLQDIVRIEMGYDPKRIMQGSCSTDLEYAARKRSQAASPTAQQVKCAYTAKSNRISYLLGTSCTRIAANVLDFAPQNQTEIVRNQTRKTAVSVQSVPGMR